MAKNELVTIQKDGKRLEVSPLVLEAHTRKGWFIVSESAEVLMVPVPDGVSLEDAEKALEGLAKPKKGKKQTKEEAPGEDPDKEPETAEEPK